MARLWHRATSSLGTRIHRLWLTTAGVWLGIRKKITDVKMRLLKDAVKAGGRPAG